jgi:predicted phosphodiesterase
VSGRLAEDPVKILVVSDIHANQPALEAVLASPHDRVLCLGDLVGFGPHPSACLRRIREVAQIVVQGDYDRAASHSLPVAQPGLTDALTRATAALTARGLDDRDRRYLATLPRWAFTTELGIRCLLVHGSPTDPLYGRLGTDPRVWPFNTFGVRADLLLVGQTHQQFDVMIGTTRVVSPGSVGLPLDGDPRAAYALIDDDGIHLRRCEYPVHQTIDALRRSGLEPPAFDELVSLLRVGSLPQPEVSAVPPASIARRTVSSSGGHA